ncbi:MAG: DNA repair protein RecN [Bacteroidota bacterium]
MLSKLHIKNYGLFEETQVEFLPGLNILTGETGAGKSLLVGALGLILGKRADNSSIFLSTDKCIIEAHFSELSPSRWKELEAFEGFDLEGNSLIIRREIRQGKSRAFINDTPVSLQVLREVGLKLLDLHAQHENQLLLSADQQVDLLDAYAGCQARTNSFGEKLLAYRQLGDTIQRMVEQEAQVKQQYDFLQHQVKELEEAQLESGEEEALEEELKLLQNTEDIREGLALATNNLYQDENDIYSQLGEVIQALEKIQDVSQDIQSNYSQLIESQETLKEVAFTLQNLLEQAESNPERLAIIEERLALYHNLKRKYNLNSSEELLTTYEKLAGQLGEADSMEGKILELKQELSQKRDELEILGLEIEELRNQAKGPLEQRVNALLEEVGFKRARYEVQIHRNTQDNGELQLDGNSIKMTPNGINKVDFLIQTNPGVPAGPLSQIASGGELSRVMLAIKTILAEKFEFPVLIFDEIDTGISGEIANKVGQVMHLLGKKFQIIAITHLPQIAAKGNQHFKLIKEIEGNSTKSTVKQLSLVGRVHELATMMSGEHPSETALRNAQEMLSEAPTR